jgi:ABC-type nitrate/sulfonate/bicarbonate transport system substrate-binding protein
MFKWALNLVLCVLGIALGLPPTFGQSQQPTEVTFAIPAMTLTFTAHFVAEDAGFFKNEGLKVSTRNLVGVASPNAVLAGSADFTMGTGPVFLRAAAQGQRFLAIANLVDRPMVELVLR